MSFNKNNRPKNSRRDDHGAPRRKAPGTLPDYTVSAFDSETGKGHTVGAAWINDDGRISIKLDQFVVLSGRGGTLTVNLFPMDWTDYDREEINKAAMRKAEPPEDFLPTANDHPDPIGPEDELPF